jgi:hypothetical protein
MPSGRKLDGSLVAARAVRLAPVGVRALSADEPLVSEY